MACRAESGPHASSPVAGRTIATMPALWFVMR
jgi:hypothetical protein